MIFCCEWGEQGLRALAPLCDVVIIVDVLSFTTCVDVAVSKGAVVYPYRHKDESASEYARVNHALLAGKRGLAGGFSLSPASLLGISTGTRLVLPSLNGATLSLTVQHAAIIAGCLRNAVAVAQAAMQLCRRIAIIPSGERWPDGSLRPCWEDWVGAGAIIAGLQESYLLKRHPHWRRIMVQLIICLHSYRPALPGANLSSRDSRRMWLSPQK